MHCHFFKTSDMNLMHHGSGIFKDKRDGRKLKPRYYLEIGEESVCMVIRFDILYNERFHILLYKKLIKVSVCFVVIDTHPFKRVDFPSAQMVKNRPAVQGTWV